MSSSYTDTSQCSEILKAKKTFNLLLSLITWLSLILFFHFLEAFDWNQTDLSFEYLLPPEAVIFGLVLFMQKPQRV